MAQALTRQLAYLLGKKQHFRIRFRQYDEAETVFFPHYPKGDVEKAPVCNGDVVAFFWSDTIKFGVATEDSIGKLSLRLLGRRAPTAGTKVYLPAGRLVCTFLPE